MSKVNPFILSDIETISEDESPRLLVDDQDNNDEDEQVAFFTKHLSVSEIIYSVFPIEYPKTSPQGVATIFNISGWSNLMACFNDIQYSIYGSGGSITIKDCPFFGVSVKKDVRKCQGIKHCSFSDVDFLKEQHNEVDMESESSTCKYKTNNQLCNRQINKSNHAINNDNKCYTLSPFASRTNFCDELQIMIQNIIASDDNATPCSIIAGKNIRLYFDFSQEYLKLCCEKCGKKYENRQNRQNEWRKTCQINHLKNVFTNWISENEKIDDFIQKCN
ncbi:hypothetical protein C1646_758509 [Rhizophagus diaphanus]|nr:hypothetical protein C1646_758509 [Rhizophagus diaphanus] [Rhizophagus sp. MUCL 43196]